MKTNRFVLGVGLPVLVFTLVLWQSIGAQPPKKPDNPGVPGLLAEIEDLNAQIALLEAIIQGYENFAPPQKTGQTLCWDPEHNPIDCEGTGLDGELQKGIGMPAPRFTDNLDGTVTDNLTGLIWLKQANYTDISGNTGFTDWPSALAFCNALEDGMCGLSDSSAAGDWRLPNVREMQSLIHYGYEKPALSDTVGTSQWSADDPFTLVQHIGYAYYWTSTMGNSVSMVWFVSMLDGSVNQRSMTQNSYVWPVRGGN